jgi:7,8-dihydro-6-hydroxymethylpterin dimethyltransferase
MASRVRPYIFYDVVISICPICYAKIEGKVVFQDGRVYLLKNCSLHGSRRVLIADDIDYYRRCREVFYQSF